MQNLSQLEANILAAGIAIPPRPEPDLHRMADLIADDVGIAAAVIRTANSPLYGLGCRVDSLAIPPGLDARDPLAECADADF